MCLPDYQGVGIGMAVSTLIASMWAGEKKLAWAEFATLLDRPARRIPELVTLLNERAPWDQSE